MRYEQVEVTPEFALALLQGNIDNRRPDKARVKSYAAEMTAGRWSLTHQAIAVAKTGKIVDGQHRLMAVVESGTTQPFWIAFDADESTFGVVDTGKVRTGNDIWKIDGKAAPNVAAIARLVWLYAHHRTATWDSNIRPTPMAVLDWVKEKDAVAALQRSAQLERRVRSEIKKLGAIPGAALAITQIFGGLEADDVFAVTFQPLITNLGFQEGQPVYAFHRLLSKRDSAGLDNPFCPSLTAHKCTQARLAAVLQFISDVVNGKGRQYYKPTFDAPLPDMSKLLSPSQPEVRRERVSV